MDEASTPFRHGVASGDPTGDAVVIWTRVTAPAARRPAGGVVAGARRRWSGLAADGQRRGVAGPRLDRPRRRRRPRARTAVLLRLRGAGGASPVGRTRTLPRGRASPAPLRPGLVREVQRRLLQRLRPDRRARRPRLRRSTSATTSTRRRRRRPRARRRAPTSAGRSTRSTSAGRSTTTGAATRSTAPIPTSRRCTPRTRSSPRIDDHELADGAWRDGADEHDEERDGPWAERRADALPGPRASGCPIRLPDPADPSASSGPSGSAASPTCS